MKNETQEQKPREVKVGDKLKSVYSGRVAEVTELFEGGAYVRLIRLKPDGTPDGRSRPEACKLADLWTRWEPAEAEV